MKRLEELRFGKQISRMIVGALIDTKQVAGAGDVKVDRHIRRILGRILVGRPFLEREADEVTIATRQMYPSNPWLLDQPLFTLATTLCSIREPNCVECRLKPHCRFFSDHSKRR